MISRRGMITAASNGMKHVGLMTGRSLSTLVKGLVETKVDEGGGLIANIILNRPPVNSLSLEM